MSSIAHRVILPGEFVRGTAEANSEQVRPLRTRIADLRYPVVSKLVANREVPLLHGWEILLGKRSADEHHQAIFNANWSCRDDVAVVVISPAVVTGCPLAVYKLLFETGGEKLA